MEVRTTEKHAGEIGIESMDPDSVPGDSADNPYTMSDPGWDPDGWRQYLVVIANEVVRPAIQGKVWASDLVRDTFVAAQRQEQLAWEQIDRRTGCTADMARRIWSGAIPQLRTELAKHGSVP